MGGARKLPENEAAAVKNIAELVASFPGHVGGSRKWNGKEATAMNCSQGCELVVRFRKTPMHVCLPVVRKRCRDGALPIC